MGKQKWMIVIIVLFVTVSGIFYSVSYEKKEEAVFLTEENNIDISKQSEEDFDTEVASQPNDSKEDVVSSEKDIEEKSNSNKESKDVIYVHICGQVVSPGVYCVDKESRVTDLIKMAGGFTEYASVDYVNQAQKLTDGEKIYIPSKEEVTQNNLPSEMTQETVSGKVNINTADKESLMTLPGIGESKAEAIIQYREERGEFQSIEELKQIEGIKDGVFNKIKDEIVV